MKIFYYNPDNTNIYEFQNENKLTIHELTIQAIRECIVSDLDELQFMKIMPTNTIFTVKRHLFKDSLDKAISYFESIEMYEKCPECVELLNLID